MEPFRLDPDEQKTLRGMDRDIAMIRETIAKMKSIGLPVDEQSERLEMAIKTRDGLLREFGSPIIPR